MSRRGELDLDGREIELIVLDVDGTLIDSGFNLHPRTRAVLREVASQIPVVLATGRMYGQTAGLVQKLGLKAPVVCGQGSRILTADGAVLAERGLPAESARAAILEARKGGWHRQVYLAEQPVCEELRPADDARTDLRGVPIERVGDLTRVVVRGCTKLVCIGRTPYDAAVCLDALTAEVTGGDRVVRSTPYLVEVVGALAGKGPAFEWICRYLDVDPLRVLAVGDGANDVELLRLAGMGVAVCGAPPSLIAEAQAVCGPPEEAGVAELMIGLGLSSG